MGLKVFKNKATKSFENEFFFIFKHQVEQLFEQKGWEGVLIAFSETENEKFKPDIILANQNKILIIDFKKIGGTINFPQKYPDFEQNPWYNEDGDIFANRDFTNPYNQVHWHRNKFINITNIPKSNISIGVLFHGQNATLKNETPDYYNGWTAIMTRSNFIKEIECHLDVDSNFGYEFNPLSLINYASAKDYVEVKVDDDFNPEKYRTLEQENEKLSKKATTLSTQIKYLEKEKQDIISKHADLSELNKKEIEEKNKMIDQLIDEKRTLEGQIEKNQNEWIKIEKSRYKAIEEREKRKKESERTKQEYVKLEIKKLEKEETEKRRQEQENEAKTKAKSKVKIKKALTATISLIVIIVGIGISVNIIKTKNAQEEARQNGASCIPYEEVEKYENKNSVCVTYYVNDVYKDKYGHIYLNKEKLTNNDILNGKKSIFTTFIKNESILSEEYAKNTYQYKTIEVHGNIERYNDELQIQVFDKNQIKVKE